MTDDALAREVDDLKKRVTQLEKELHPPRPHRPPPRAWFNETSPPPHRYCAFCGAGEREASECEDTRCNMTIKEG